MTENLRLIGSIKLTSADSNVTADFELKAPTSSDTTWCTTDDTTCDDQSMSLDSGNDSYGVYYNWYAATAGTGTYFMSSGNASSSICPKGWRLPTGGSSGEFQTLYSNYSSSADMRSTTGPAFVLSGYRSGGSTYNQGGDGVYWSSTTYGGGGAHGLTLNSSNVYPAGGSRKYGGFSVRCTTK